MAKGLGLHMERYYARARERYVLDYVKSELIKEYGLETDAARRLPRLHDDRPQAPALGARGDREQPGRRRPVVGDRDDGPEERRHPRDGVLADYGKSKFNLAAQGHRQPGSAFKTMALMTALRQGVNPDSTSYVSRSPIELKQPPCGSPADPWEVNTYSRRGSGSMSLHRATLASDNSVYAQLTSDLGPDKVKETARMMGIRSKLNGYCAESLGGLEDGVSPLEMANAYATIVNGGYRDRPRVIRKITTRQGSQKLPARWRVKRTKAFPDGVTYEAVKILRANITGGTGGKAQIGCPQGGKTGTTDKNIDAWFVGFTPRLSTAVWVGFPGSAKISMNGLYHGANIDGGTYPAQIWGEYMRKAKGKYCGDFKQPTEPFQSQPFFGHYSRAGGKDGDDDDRNGEQTTPGEQPEERSPSRTRHAMAATTSHATASRAATTPPASIRTSTRRRPSSRRTPRRPAAARRHRPATADSGRPDWYNLRRRSRPVRAAVVGMHEGSAGSTPRACWI